MQNQITAKINEIKSQFFALQSQMNPHFLHNMLAIISMESQIDGNEKIPDICKKLGEILRYNSQMGDGYSTIEQECKIAEDYMLLMKVRYEDLFIYSINIQDDAKKIIIPKFIIQPICENCFKHGFKNVEPIWTININIWKEDKNWFIEIKDNGSGFSNDYLEKFKNENLVFDIADINLLLEKVSIGGLCLSNIYAKMKIIYDNDFTFKLYNTEKGATVLLGGNDNDKSFNS